MWMIQLQLISITDQLSTEQQKFVQVENKSIFAAAAFRPTAWKPRLRFDSRLLEAVLTHCRMYREHFCVGQLLSIPYTKTGIIGMAFAVSKTRRLTATTIGKGTTISFSSRKKDHSTWTVSAPLRFSVKVPEEAKVTVAAAIASTLQQLQQMQWMYYDPGKQHLIDKFL